MSTGVRFVIRRDDKENECLEGKEKGKGEKMQCSPQESVAVFD